MAAVGERVVDEQRHRHLQAALGVWRKRAPGDARVGFLTARHGLDERAVMQPRERGDKIHALHVRVLAQRAVQPAALPLGVCGAAFLYFSGRAPERLDRVFGNRAVRFLSAISYNFYIWHQFLAVKLKEFHIPAYVSEFPQMSEGRAWQTKYTLLCFAAAFLLSAALTYLVEKPAGRALLRLRARKEKV